MSQRWDMIIVGGGIVGCSAAYYAAKQGLKPLVIERDAVAAAQSGRALGYVRRQGRDLRELPMMIDAMDIWRDLERELGRPIGWRQGGNLWCAKDDASLGKLEDWLDKARDFDLPTRLLAPAEIDSIVPGMRHSFKGALYTHDDGMADPVASTRAIADAAMDNGAVIRTGNIVDKIDTAGGSVQGVWVGDQCYESDIVICAAGAGSSKLLRPHGLLFPQDWIRASILKTEPVERRIEPGVVSGTIGIRQGADGSLYAYHATVTYDVRIDSPRYANWFKAFLADDAISIKINLFSKLRRGTSLRTTTPPGDIPDSWQAPYPDHDVLALADDELRGLFPDLEDVRTVAQWGGYIESTPDALPVIGKVGSVTGLLVASGYSGHGFGTGPIGGKRIVELATTGQSEIPAALRPGRFADGTWLDGEASAI